MTSVLKKKHGEWDSAKTFEKEEGACAENIQWKSWVPPQRGGWTKGQELDKNGSQKNKESSVGAHSLCVVGNWYRMDVEEEG